MLPLKDIEEIVYVIVASVVGSASVIYGLQKLGLMGKIKCQEEVKAGCPYGAHEEMVAMLKEIRDTQIGNVQKHLRYARDLDKGDKEFSTIKSQLSFLREGIGILMDRTGDRPSHWRE
jgi:hypothetical protein